MPDRTASVQEPQSFLNKLVAIGISNIAYLRRLFPKTEYIDIPFEGLSVKMLRDNGTCPAAAKLLALLQGAFDSLDKKYVSHYGFLYFKIDNS
jgi:hypothetical protein